MKINTKLIAIAKNEGAYLPQWIYHHFSIGFDKIEIYINDTTDNSISICEKIQQNHSGLTFHSADKLRHESIKEQRSFQISAYNNSLHHSSETTHLMALDLDEYLICKNMNERLSTLLERQKSPDCLSFLWYSDDYSSKESFSHPLQLENKIYRMDHVKTISKLSKKVHSCSHHNFIYKNEERVINLLLSFKLGLLVYDNVHLFLGEIFRRPSSRHSHSNLISQHPNSPVQEQSRRKRWDREAGNGNEAMILLRVNGRVDNKVWH